MKSKLSSRKILSLVKEVKKDRTWSISNKMLYDICKKYPKHNKVEIVVAKTILIGRVYSAALERGYAKSTEKGDLFYRVSVFKSFQSFFEKKNIRDYQAKIRNSGHVRSALKLHELLVIQLEKLRNLKKISFASKYLHFHYPDVFYIFDSRAKKGLSFLARQLDIRISGSTQLIGIEDKKYARFMLLCLAIHTEIERITNQKLTIRQFDSLLIRLAII